MKTLIIGDIHSRWIKVLHVLQRAGAIDDHGKRVDGFHIIQLGDSVSLGYGDKEKEFYEWFIDGWVDELIIGNHELPAFWWNGNDMKLGFRGWEDRDRECEKLVKKAYDEGRYKASTYVGPWLITHAGVAPIYQNVHGFRKRGSHQPGMAADEISYHLNRKFEACQRNREYDPVISGKWSSGDGIFWLRIWHLNNGYAHMHIPQIVGHTPDKNYAPKELVKDRLWCIDSPPVHDYMQGGVVGLLTEDDGETFRMIYEE